LCGGELRGASTGEEYEPFCSHIDEIKDEPKPYGSDERTGPLNILKVGRPFAKYWVDSYQYEIEDEKV
jgi:hypothetical protein